MGHPQAGQPFTGHYDDMTSKWLNVEYQTMFVQKAGYVKHSKALLSLEPTSP